MCTPTSYLLGSAGDTRPSPPSARSSQVFLKEMVVSGAWLWPHPSHSGLQVLEDDCAVVAEHLRDAAGTGRSPARNKPQQCQQEGAEGGLGGHLEGTPGPGLVCGPVGCLPAQGASL